MINMANWSYRVNNIKKNILKALHKRKASRTWWSSLTLKIRRFVENQKKTF